MSNDPSNPSRSELDKYFPRFNGKAVASKSQARKLGEWAASHAITAVVIFGVDVIYAINKHGAAVELPIIFNYFIWSMAALHTAGAAFLAAKMARKRARKGQVGLEIRFAGAKPGDEGFQIADWPEDIPMPSAEEVSDEGGDPEQEG